MFHPPTIGRKVWIKISITRPTDIQKENWKNQKTCWCLRSMGMSGCSGMVRVA